MEHVKSLFGIALLVAALYYLKNVIPPLGKLTGTTPAFLAAAGVAVAIGVAIGAVHLSFHDTWLRRLRKGLGVALAVAGFFAATNYVLTPKIELAWHKSEPEAVHLARAANKPILVDFMADWCLPCKELEVQVFAHPDVASRLQDFTLLKVDLTREGEDESLERLKEKYGVTTLPAVRLVLPDGRIVAQVNELVAVPEFLRILDKARS
jgi:thiol:disulfide interchange protein DsbD